MPDTGKPLIIQSDASILLDVHDTAAAEARQEIAPFCELEKSPEHMHTYRITPISLWNAASAGISGEKILEHLETWSRFPVPENVKTEILDIISRFGKLVLSPTDTKDQFLLTVDDELIRKEIEHRKNLQKMLIPVPEGFLLSIFDRGSVKQELIKLGYPVDDRAPLKEGERLPFSFREFTLDGRPFSVRDYQNEAAATFVGNRLPGSGYGIAVLQ